MPQITIWGRYFLFLRQLLMIKHPHHRLTTQRRYLGVLFFVFIGIDRQKTGLFYYFSGILQERVFLRIIQIKLNNASI